MNRYSRHFDSASEFTRQMVDELHSGELPTSIRRDLKETWDFYLEPEVRRELARMNRFKRGIYSTGYLFRGLFLKLTPVRRAFLLFSLYLMWIGLPDNALQTVSGFALVLFVLGLELKDKLLARDELEAGRAVQLALMPSHLPELPGWDVWMYTTPANDVGGDLIDHMMHGSDRLSLALGDVAGKGLPAALMAARLQATLRALLPEGNDAGLLMNTLNRVVCRDGLPSKFASMVVLDVAAGKPDVQLVNAGHLPPVHVHSDGCTPLGRGGPAVGLLPSARYASTHVRLDTDDLLIVYSDGVTEARNELGDFYGDDRFLELIQHVHGLSAEDVGERLLRVVNEFMGSARPNDDLSLVILRRRP
ncbi:MAG: hypothetical protein COV99_06885 [Bacteroidetes bacterium CG12_big_fil_rev_8_21_14_0_65_60_17]|nr:MAG: hypothetical protein COV99_06885 [Bacteroidetes bacterium CG12_big_fil_rev_8_21_14_0_65_60_17]